MNMKDKQTAVEWLIDKHFGGIENVTPDFKKHIEQAKEMEKEQIIDALLFGDVLSPNTAETYYKETYGDNK